MTPLSQPSPQHSAIPKFIAPAFLATTSVGFLDATYLTVKFYLGTAINCSLLNGCDLVTGSAYASIGPVPISLLGALYYLTLAILAVFSLDTAKPAAMRFAAWVSPAGFLVSLILLYLQIFVLKALCLYCLISALTSTVLFLLGLAVILKGRVRSKSNEFSPESI